MVSLAYTLSRFDEELAAFAVNLPGGVGEFYLRPAPVRRADTRRVPAKSVLLRLWCARTVLVCGSWHMHASCHSALCMQKTPSNFCAMWGSCLATSLHTCAWHHLACRQPGCMWLAAWQSERLGLCLAVRRASMSGRGSARCGMRMCRKTCALPACSRWATMQCRSPGRTASTRCGQQSVSPANTALAPP